MARALLTGSPAQVFALVHTADGPVAAARGSFAQGWLGVSSMSVLASHRRRGLASALLVALADWSARFGAVSAFLQVGRDNDAARALYHRHGFTVHTQLDLLAPADDNR